MSHDFFFEGAGRREALDTLFDAVAERRLLLVTGESGSGRSALLARFQAEADPDVLALARVQGDILMSPLQCVQAVADALGAADAWAEGLAGPFAAVRAAGRQPVVLVDDAHDLGQETLATLVDACRADEVGLVLAGDEALALLVPAGSVGRQVELRPLSAQQSEDFIAALLAVEAEDDLPSHRTMASLHKQAAGLPGRLVALVRGGALAQRSWWPVALPAGLPVWHLALAAVALALLAWLVPHTTSDDEDASAVVEFEVPLPGVPAEPSPAASSRLTAAATPAPLTPATVELQVPPPPAVAGAAVPVTAAPPAVVVTPPAAVAPAPAPAAVPASRYTADEQWLQARKASRYTLQVFASFNADSVKALQQRFPQQVRVFRTVREGLPWHVAVVGDFRNRDDARASAGKLPRGLAELKPWPRSFQGIQDELRRRP